MLFADWPALTFTFALCTVFLAAGFLFGFLAREFMDAPTDPNEANGNGQRPVTFYLDKDEERTVNEAIVHRMSLRDPVTKTMSRGEGLTSICGLYVNEQLLDDDRELEYDDSVNFPGNDA